jgi:hypothetical protein
MPYTVTDTQQVKSMTRGGTLVTNYRVSIQTENGATGDIDIAAKDWNPDRIKEILDEFATSLDFAFSLTP